MKPKFSYKLYPVPDYKLTPPAITPKKLLQRVNLLEKLKHLQAYKKKLLVIEAQAGSGKSVFAQQYIQESDCSFGWYQLGPEDKDPIALLNVLVTLFLKELPEYRSENVMPALVEGAIHHSEAPRFGAMLAQELSNISGPLFVLVLDDLHLIENSRESAAILTSLIQEAPPWMQWILVSRHSVKSVLEINRFNVPSLRIESADLEFSFEESAQLFHSIFGLSLPSEQIQKLQQQTDGWITGLILAGLQNDKTRGLSASDNEDFFASANIQSHLAELFLQDVLEKISQERLQEILQLVLLNDMPLPLLCDILGEEAGEGLAREMVLKNRFFRCIDEDSRIFNFHHLFRESLLPVAKKQLPKETQMRVYQQAIRYHLRCKEPLQALQYTVLSGEMSLCEDILSQFGFELLHLNQIKTLHQILSTFPEDTILNYPWLCFYYGTCLYDSQPFESLPYLKKAKALFSDQNDELGMLLTNSQLVEFHVIIDGLFYLMKSNLAGLENIFIRKHETLSLPIKLRIAYSLALGNCFLQSDMRKVERYDTMALRLSMENHLDNMTAAIRVLRAYRHSFVGDWDGCRKEIEASFPFMINPRVSTLSKLFLRMLQVNLLEMDGDFVNYRDQKQTLEQVVEKDVVSQSIIGPFLHIWDIDSALAENDIDTAESILHSALQSSFAASEAHMRSQFLHYHALILALRKKEKESLEALHESFNLRQQVGGNSFLILNYQILGAAFAQLGMIENAEDYFSKALIISGEIGEIFQRCSIHAHRAWMRWQSGDELNALEDVEQCLYYMKRGRYTHFFSFIPQVMEPVLALALRHDFESDYAHEILSEKLHKGIAKDRALIPILEIRLLGNMTISSNNGQQLNVIDLTKNVQQLLYILIESPGRQISQSFLSHHFWPNKTTKKQRSSLDVLIFLLRKALTLLVAPAKPIEYLAIEQGVVKLKNCRIDILQFLQHAKQGRSLAKSGKRWQAGNSFHLAFSLWMDGGLADLNMGGIEIFQEVVKQEYLSSSMVWASILEEQGEITKASQLLVSAFYHSPEDKDLAIQSYDMHARSGNQNQAQNIIQNYKKAHQQLSEDPQEVEEAMAAFWQNSRPE